MTTTSSKPAAVSTADALKDIFSKNNVAEFNKQTLLLENTDLLRKYYVAALNKSPGFDKENAAIIKSKFYEASSVVRQIGPYPFYDVAYSVDSDTPRFLPFVSNVEYVDKKTELTDFYLNKKSFRNYFNLTPEKIAHMGHYMFVTEELVDPSGESDTFTKTIINNKNSAEGLILDPTTGRKGGAGIQSISVNYEGIDSETKRIVMANVKYVFQDTKEMLSEPYLRLFLLDTKKEIEGKNYRRTINFNIGWDTNDADLKGANGIDFDKLHLSLRTNLVNYSINLNQDGSIIVDATYRGSFIESLSSANANILEFSKAVAEKIKGDVEKKEKLALSSAKKANEKAKEKRVLILILEAFRKETAELISAATGGRKKHGDVSDYNTYINNVFGENKPDILGQPWSSALNSVLGSTSDVTKKAFTRLGFSTSHKRSVAWNLIKQEHKDLSTRVFDRVVSSTIRSSAKAAELRVLQLEEATARINELQKELSEASTAATNSLGIAAAELTKQANLAKLSALRQIGKKLIEESSVHYLLVKRSTVEEYKFLVLEGATSAIKDLTRMDSATGNGPTAHIGDLKDAEALDLDTSRGPSGTVDEEKHQIIPFVFFGDLIKSVLEHIPAGPKDPTSGDSPSVYELIFKNGSDVRVDFGYISYNTPLSNISIRDFPIYYLPVSLVEINNFFNREVVSKGLTYYSINNFISDMCKKFFAGAFEQCVRDSGAQGFIPPKLSVLNTTTKDYSAPELAAKFVGNGANQRLDSFDMKKAKITTNHVVDNVFIFSAKETIRDLGAKSLLPVGESSGFGNFAANMLHGVPHFYFLGVDRGIEKSITLTDIADSSTKQAVYYSSRSSLVADGVTANKLYKKTGIPPAVFQAEVETIGFPLFNIGQLIYIDLINQQVEDDPTRMFKASGYYSIIKVSHEITAETFSSKITAIIQVPWSDRREIMKEINDPSSSGVSSKTTKLTKKDRKKLQRTLALQKIADETNEADRLFEEERERQTLTADQVSAEINKAKESENYKKVQEQRKAFEEEQKKSIGGWKAKNSKAYTKKQKELKREYPDKPDKVEEEMNKFIIDEIKKEAAATAKTEKEESE